LKFIENNEDSKPKEPFQESNPEENKKPPLDENLIS
jgi:hypothetical protein